MNHLKLAIPLLISSTSCCAIASLDPPDCSGTERWPSAMVQADLRNEFDVSLATISNIKVDRIANEQLDDEVHRQVHDIKVSLKNGTQYQAVTVHDASHEECSMSMVKIYWVESVEGTLY